MKSASFWPAPSSVFNPLFLYKFQCELIIDIDVHHNEVNSFFKLRNIYLLNHQLCGSEEFFLVNQRTFRIIDPEISLVPVRNGIDLYIDDGGRRVWIEQ